MRFESLRIAVHALVLTVLVIHALNLTEAQVRSSTNYSLMSDSINVGGGLSTSTNYTQESTVGEIASGRSSSTDYAINAGFQQMQVSFISVTGAGNVTMTPNIYGITGGTSNGSTSVTVITDSPAGYQLFIAASNDPAMQRVGGGSTIADYDAGAEPDFSFITNTDDSHLGFTPEGEDIADEFLDDGGLCDNGGLLDTALSCWDGMTTTNRVIAEGNAPNHPNGATTTIHFRVGVGSTVGLPAGVYTATTTLTALPL